MDFTSMFGGAGGAGGAGKTQSSASAASVIGARNEQLKLEALAPWIVGGVVIAILAIAAVAIAVIRR